MSVIRDLRPATPPSLTDILRTITEAAARAAYDVIARGDRACGGEAALAMRAALGRLPIGGRVVAGEGEPGETIALYNGEAFGSPEAPQFDIAADPIEGCTYLAEGMTNALAAVALAPRGSLFAPGPAFYMEKFAASPAAKGRIDPALPVEDKLSVLADCLGKPVSQLTVYVLEKPRHRLLVERIKQAGARVVLYPAGDVAGAVMAATPGSGIDALMGTGGAREGILSACAIRALGGEFQGRLDPQLATERRAVEAAGLDCRRWYRAEDLVASDQVFFCATGIANGLLFQGVERGERFETTHSLVIAGAFHERRYLTTYHPRHEIG